MSNALIVFAKEPVVGDVKTRLKGCFSDTELIQLYKAFVQDALAAAGKVKNAKKLLAFSSQRAPRFLKSVAGNFELIEQKGRTLGNRMHNAFVHAYERKLRRTVIIGTDSPTLPFTLVQRAFKELKHKDVVIGPSADGGFYLFAMKEPCAEIFKGVRWSTASVLKKTLNNARSLEKTTALLKQWYDVDGRLGLERLKNDLRRSKRKGFADHARMVLNNNHML